MAIGERIKAVRKAAGLTQREFAEKLGLKRNTVGSYEIDQISPSDRTIGDICRVFGVREEWLKDGVEPMYASKPEDEPLEKLLKEKVVTVEDAALIRSFLELLPGSRQVVLDFVWSCVAKLNAPVQSSGQGDLVAELAALRRMNEEALAQNRQLLAQNQELMEKLDAMEKEDAEREASGHPAPAKADRSLSH